MIETSSVLMLESCSCADQVEDLYFNDFDYDDHYIGSMQSKCFAQQHALPSQLAHLETSPLVQRKLDRKSRVQYQGVDVPCLAHGRWNNDMEPSR
eukprot:2594338-Amphidinium_carterae.1